MTLKWKGISVPIGKEHVTQEGTEVAAFVLWDSLCFP